MKVIVDQEIKIDPNCTVELRIGNTSRGQDLAYRWARIDSALKKAGIWREAMS